MTEFGFKDLEIKYGIQTIFSTIPFQNNENNDTGNVKRSNKTEFEKEIEDVYFGDFKGNLGYVTPDALYKPLKYFMLGDYDVVYISLINNFKFSHRLFEPISKNGKNYNTHTFQNYSGFLLNQSQDEVLNIFNPIEQSPISYFIGVINLKLNNGLFIGNGLKIIAEIYKWIDRKINNDEKYKKDIKSYILTQTFSWFELSLNLFIDNPNTLSWILQQIRSLKLKDILSDSNNQQLLDNSLYKGLFPKTDIETLKNTSVFADTVTQFGFNSKLIESKLDDPYCKGFMDYANKELQLKTEIEWQVKPGHVPNLIDFIKRDDYLQGFFFKDSQDYDCHANMVLGKCDYLLTERASSILSNFHLIRHVARKSKLYTHIRKIRTRIYFDDLEEELLKNQKQIKRTDFLNWDDKLKKLAIDSGKFYEYDKKLKKLKVSRHIRNKILKIFSNYNNGILDPIQFTYFIDMSVLIKNLCRYIDHESDLNDTETKPITEITGKLLIFIKTFQEAYDVRFLNGYQFESISDFDLDYNNSIQQLLSSYGIFVFHYGKLFYKDDLYAPVIQLNDIDTESDKYSINYAIHHFTSPEFVFTPLAKEVLNSLLQDEEFLDIKDKYEDVISALKEEINESYFDDLIKSGTFDLDYFIIDCIRFYITFEGDFDLYQHWIWSYNFQNTSLYDTDGMFNENHLKTEMLRLLMLQKYIRQENSGQPSFYNDNSINQKISCPISHLDAYWFLHCDKLDIITDSIFENFSKNEIIKSLYIQLQNYINHKINYFTYNEDNEPYLRIIKNCLKNHYSENKEKVTIVNRDWSNGDFSKNNKEDDILYSVDQIGSQYFYSNKATQTYFEYNAKIILSIIDFATQNKKSFISNLRT